jgi:hypothetical protein
VNLCTLRVVVVTVAGVLVPFATVFAWVQVEWPPASEFGPRQNERAAIIEAAARAGLSNPVRARMLSPQFGCRAVALESERLYDGSRRSWRWVYVEDDTTSADCLLRKFRSGWRARGRVWDATEWLVERGRVRVWITLNDYMTGDGRHHTISYEDAKKVVLAFVDSRVVDRRKPGNRVPQDPPLPVGPDAQQIDAVASRARGWEVFANGWTFDVEAGADRLVVTASSYPIP